MLIGNIRAPGCMLRWPKIKRIDPRFLEEEKIKRRR
jgi:hypothetical protein